MTEFEMYEKSLKRIWTKIDKNSQCEVIAHKSEGYINVYDYWGTCFMTLTFDNQGNLIELDID